HSTTGTIYHDAGADYVFSDISDDKAVMPLSFEQVLAKGHDADFWFFKYYSDSDFSYESLANDYELYAEFKAFKDRNIWACNTKYLPYYDIVPFRPDILLRDMVAILHPEILPEYQPRFFTRMK
ncbi:MAG: ABC transporter substrate-binding protein, partial [Bacteroidales bacterium]|nr:ABC transporter substrate-binding protein [Bacteroidales bacterium]